MDTDKNYFILSEKVYERLKLLVQIILPAFSVFYMSIASIWDFPEPEKVVGTIAAFTALLGVLLKISSNQYQNSDAAFDGDAIVSTTELGKKMVSLELNKLPKEILDQKNLRFKVKHE